jgi:hypothetical protein
VSGEAAGGAARWSVVEAIAWVATLSAARTRKLPGVPTEPRPVTLAEVVKRAAEVVDPADGDPDIGSYELAFEDADEPVRALSDVPERVRGVLYGLDPEQQSGALQMAGAVTTYLSFRRDEVREHGDELLRLAARAEWKGDPPAAVADWLSAQGIEL